MKKKQEDDLIKLMVIGLLMVGATYLYPAVSSLRIIGLMAVVIGLLPLMYGILSEKKRFSKAKIAEIDGMTGIEFERYVVYLLLNNGYQKAVETGEGPDQGIDVKATKENVRYGIQCKRWKKNVGNKAVQEVYAGKDFYRLGQAVVVTNSYFTSSAKQLAKQLEIDLWDRDTLIKMIEKIPAEKNKC